MALRPVMYAALGMAGVAGLSCVAAADNDQLKCTKAPKANWMSQTATKNLLKKQGYKEVREIDMTDGHCYKVYAVDAKGEKVELYLDPTSGNVVAKED